MTWPTAPSSSALPSDQLDNALDSPAGARDQLLQLKARVDELTAALVAVISNGEPALPNQLPFLAALLFRTSSQVSGNTLVFDAVAVGGALVLPGSDAVTLPEEYGTITVNLLFRNNGASSQVASAFLQVGSLFVSRQFVTVPVGETRGVLLAFTGFLTGQAVVSFSPMGSGGLFIPSDNKGNSFSMLVLP